MPTRKSKNNLRGATPRSCIEETQALTLSRIPNHR